MKDNIRHLVGNHVAPYLYCDNFIPGETVIPYSGPYWDQQESEAAIGAFLNGDWITAGEKVFAFEREFSRKFNVGYSLMVNSGSSANLVMITALKKFLGWEDGDEVIVSPVGFPTTISVLYQNRLTPVFVDIEWDTLNFDLNQIEDKITPKTKAIFVSPVLGNPPDIYKLLEICVRFDLKLIGDNCDSLGTKWDGKYLGEYYIAFTNSFYPSHHISTGEGGMVCTDNKQLMRMMVSMAWWGRDCWCIGSDNLLKDGTCTNRFDRWLDLYDGVVDHKYVFSNMGFNLKPLDLQGAIGLVQLSKFDEISTRRKRSKITIEKILMSNIEGVGGVTYKVGRADVCWFGTPFICEGDLKHRLVEYLEHNKIQTRNYFAGNILIHPGFQALDDYRKYPEANKVLERVFFLGSAPHYSEKVFSYIEDVAKRWN